jgi:hypothetical protein
MSRGSLGKRDGWVRIGLSPPRERSAAERNRSRVANRGYRSDRQSLKSPTTRQAMSVTIDALSPQACEAFLLSRSRRAATSPEAPLADFRRGMALERALAAAGGLLIAGCDPTGNGGTLPGFGDQREVELLVEAGFSPVEAIRIATRTFSS